jgi:hypothetical protein
MKVFSQEIEGGREQTHDAGKHKRGANGFTGCEPKDQDQRGNGEAAPTNAGETHRESNQKPDNEGHALSRFEKV